MEHALKREKPSRGDSKPGSWEAYVADPSATGRRGWDRRLIDSVHAAGIQEDYEGVTRKGDLMPHELDEARLKAAKAKEQMRLRRQEELEEDFIPRIDGHVPQFWYGFDDGVPEEKKSNWESLSVERRREGGEPESETENSTEETEEPSESSSDSETETTSEEEAEPVMEKPKKDCGRRQRDRRRGFVKGLRRTGVTKGAFTIQRAPTVATSDTEVIGSGPLRSRTIQRAPTGATIDTDVIGSGPLRFPGPSESQGAEADGVEQEEEDGEDDEDDEDEEEDVCNDPDCVSCQPVKEPEEASFSPFVYTYLFNR